MEVATTDADAVTASINDSATTATLVTELGNEAGGSFRTTFRPTM
jgi:hypothetical protein